jgi:alkaline phosphatase
MIGDGMGFSHIYRTMDSVLYSSASPVDMNILRFRQIALAKTTSADNKITDSAAAGTALATGTKTNNGYLGVDTNNAPLKSILKYAEENGLATGLVATSDITHATPASFIANVQSRNQADEIARQFLFTDIDVFIGGGYNSFSVRADSINYIDSLKAHNYHVATSLNELKQFKAEGKLAGLIYPSHAPKVSEGRGDMLSYSTSLAIDLLDNNDNGFFLMVEGSQIDWGAHDNKQNYMVSELLDFDKTVGLVLDYATTHPETLVIVTADHETGGLSLIENEIVKGELKTHFSTKHHSAGFVPVFAFGPGAERFSGFIDNTDIFKIMMSLFNFTY